MAEWGWWCRRCRVRRRQPRPVEGVRDGYDCARCGDVLVWKQLPKPEPNPADGVQLGFDL